MDDLESAGSSCTANNTIKNCSLMEERKKVNYNTDLGKSGILIVNGNGIGNGAVTEKVKNGSFKEVAEHKLLGTWIDKTGRYLINIIKRKEKLEFMIGSTKRIANSTTMGKLAISARLKMTETVLVPSFLFNAEAFPVFTNDELSLLEGVQATMLRRLLEVPSSTPYLPLLLETGMWTMEGRIEYKKLMLYHHIINSPDERIIKRIVLTQKEMAREGTWYHTITLILKKYQLTNVSINAIKKSAWKKIVKSKIGEVMEREIRSACTKMKKGRTVADDEYKKKDYLSEVSVEDSKSITRMRLHMNELPCNYGGGHVCWLCGENSVNTEHYFQCSETELVKLYWNTESQDMKRNETLNLTRASKFMELVEKKNIHGRNSVNIPGTLKVIINLFYLFVVAWRRSSNLGFVNNHNNHRTDLDFFCKFCK